MHLYFLLNIVIGKGDYFNSESPKCVEKQTVVKGDRMQLEGSHLPNCGNINMHSSLWHNVTILKKTYFV